MTPIDEFNIHGTMDYVPELESKFNIRKLLKINESDIDDENGKFNKKEVKDAYEKYVLKDILQRLLFSLEKSEGIEINTDIDGNLEIINGDSSKKERIQRYLKIYFENNRQEDISKAKKVIEIQRSKEKNELTELPNKKGLRSAFDREVEKKYDIKKEEKHIVILVNIDLDDFKIINDEYNHNTGDDVLKSFAKAMEKTKRSQGDTMAHYSGDEFGMLISMDIKKDTTSEELDKKIQEILKRKFKKIQELTERPQKLTEKNLSEKDFANVLVNKNNEPLPYTNKNGNQLKDSDGELLYRGKQEISAGYSIVEQNLQEKQYFSDHHTAADKGSEFSKIVRILKETKNENIETIDRIVNSQNIDKMTEEFSESEIKKLQFIRNSKRKLGEAFPEIEGQELKEKVKTLLDELEEKNNKLKKEKN